MKQRALGTQGLAVSALGLGTMGMTMAYGPSDEQEGIVPIPGTRSAQRMEENAGATQVELSPDDLRRIDEAFPDGAYGARYAEASLPNWV